MGGLVFRGAFNKLKLAVKSSKICNWLLPYYSVSTSYRGEALLHVLTEVYYAVKKSGRILNTCFSI